MRILCLFDHYQVVNVKKILCLSKKTGILFSEARFFY